MKNFGVFLVFLFFSSPAIATPQETPTGYISWFGAGWNSQTVRVQVEFAFFNPDNCSMTDGYIVDPDNPGRDLFNSTLLSAFLTGRKVTLIVDGCYLNRPKIISVGVQK